MALCDPLLLCADVDCPGAWVLYTALKQPENWSIQIVKSPASVTVSSDAEEEKFRLSEDDVNRIKQSLSFQYAYSAATQMPSKQTATQLKGRHKDQEVSENTAHDAILRRWRRPSFVDASHDGREYGTALHKVLEHIDYAACSDFDGVRGELDRLVQERYISVQQAVMIDPKKIAQFFNTDIGKKLRSDTEVLREFKFSILEDAAKYSPEMKGEEILLQGVVDCALIEPDGITVIDFKTDRVTEETIGSVSDGYRPQILAYASAMERIFALPVKTAQLYFFSVNTFVKVK
jgi:ATP-dependent helicase/nuclease subunit A